VVKFCTDCSKGQGLYSVHSWCDLIYVSLLLSGNATVACQQKCHSLESLYMFCSLACSALSASSEKACLVLVAMGCIYSKETGTV
jgi:hypothetical protein